MCSIDDHAQGEAGPTVEHQLQQTQIVGSPVIIHPSITEENDTNLTVQSTMTQPNQHLQPIEHANAPSSDVKLTGSSSHHSSYLQPSKQPISPPLSSSVSTGIHNFVKPYMASCIMEVCV